MRVVGTLPLKLSPKLMAERHHAVKIAFPSPPNDEYFLPRQHTLLQLASGGGSCRLQLSAFSRSGVTMLSSSLPPTPLVSSRNAL